MLQKTSNNIFFILARQTEIGTHTFTHAKVLKLYIFSESVLFAKLEAWDNKFTLGAHTFTHAIELTNQKVYNFGYLFIHALFTLRVNFNQKEKRYEKHSKQMD